MPRRKRKSKRRGDLTNAQFWELLLGPSSSHEAGALWSSSFPTEADREHAYFLNVDAVSGFGAAGARPWGWWAYESGIGAQPKEHKDVLWLAEHGRLTEEEAAELLRHDAHGIGGPSGERLHEIATAIRARSAARRGRPTIARAT